MEEFEAEIQRKIDFNRSLYERLESAETPDEDEESSAGFGVETEKDEEDLRGSNPTTPTYEEGGRFLVILNNANKSDFTCKSQAKLKVCSFLKNLI